MTQNPIGPIDEDALKLIQELAWSHQLVAHAEIVKDEGGRQVLHIALDMDRYPPNVERVTIRVTWRATDDYSFHYREVWTTNNAWECRWDRHPHPHNAAREHFHEPPTAQEEPITDRVAHLEPRFLFIRTMATTRERIDQLWSEQALDN